MPNAPAQVVTTPWELPVGIDLAVEEFVAAVQAARNHFQVEMSTMERCGSAADGKDWSWEMINFYCSFPIFEGAKPSVRACFTGVLRGEGPYARYAVQTYRQAYDFCKSRPEFAWLKKNGQLEMFQYIMVSQGGVGASTKSIFSDRSIERAKEQLSR